MGIGGARRRQARATTGFRCRVACIVRKLLPLVLAAAVAASLPAGGAALATAGRDDAPAASGATAEPAASAAKKRRCDRNYRGRCLRPHVSDYDCAGGSGNGPYYVRGPFRVVGDDHYGLDSDGDGIACES
jgi:hypothetical protein